MSKYRYLTAGKMKVFSLGMLILSVLAVNAHAQGILGSAGDFAVLGASTVTNTGATTLNGNLGVSPGTAITGTGTITLSGAIYTGAPGVAATAQADALAAFDAMGPTSALAAAALLTTPGTNNLTGDNLGGLTLSAGSGTTSTVTVNSTSTTATVYAFSSSAQLTGKVILNFGGESDQTIVIDTGSTLTTASGSSVLEEGANSTDNVLWLVGSAATIGTTTSLAGNIIAEDLVAMNTGATDGCGGVISLTAAVTLQGNTISTGCSGGTTVGTPTPVTPAPIPPGTGTTVRVPEGGSTLLYLCSFLLPLGAMRAFRFRRSI